MQSRSLPPVAGRGVLLSTPITLMLLPDESKPCRKPAEPATNGNHGHPREIIAPLVARRPRAATGRALTTTLHPEMHHADLLGPARHDKITDLPHLKRPPQSGALRETWLLGEKDTPRLSTRKRASRFLVLSRKNHPFLLLHSPPLPPLFPLLLLLPQPRRRQPLHPLHLPSPPYPRRRTRTKQIVRPLVRLICLKVTMNKRSLRGGSVTGRIAKLGTAIHVPITCTVVTIIVDC